MGYVKDGEKRYYIEVIASGTLIVAAAALRRAIAHSIVNPALLLTVKLLPLLPLTLFGVAIWRYYRRCDELQRQTMLKTAGATGLLSLLVLMAWFITQPAGFPPLTGMITLMVITVCCLLCSAVIKFLEGRAEGGLKQAFMRLIPLLSLVALMLGFYAVLRHALSPRSEPYLWSFLWMGGTTAIVLIYRLIKHRVEP